MHWATWDDEYVIFDEGSGQTHCIDAVRAFVVNCVLDGVCSPNNLVDELANVPRLADSFNLTELVETILNELCSHGLVEVVGV
ncbi:HPr-rel-A system PqqD family peptide chaperone [Rhodoferax sp.]|uniref:HPr-rel-A system PqqD family peptide chaperone n=1 Tax=Rhodoferax sp. TaxID=50421 RepID=UPI003451CF3F